jgi:hypothetical protein
LPIIPPGAALVPQTAIDSVHLGKIPGRYLPYKKLWSGLPGEWPTIGLLPRYQMQCGSWPTENVGLRAEMFPGLDIDVASEEARDLVEVLSTLHLGKAPARVRGNAPRALLVFQLDGEEPIRKMRLVFKDDKGVEHAIEMLGLGQQYVIAGKHPSGSMYEWREGSSLIVWGAEGLSKVTAEAARAFFASVHSEIINRGWTVVQNLKQRHNGPAIGGTAVADLEPLLATDLALAALNAIPNTNAVLPLREDIVSVLAGLKAAIGREALREDVKASAREWAVRHGFADVKYFETVWGSLSHVRVGPHALVSRARQFGWFDDAPLDFPDDVAATEIKIVAAKAAADDEDAALRAVAERLLYWGEAEKFIVRANGKLFSHRALNSTNGLGTEIAPSGASGTKAASHRLINSSLVQQVDGVTYRPAAPQLQQTADGLFYNRWRDYGMVLPAIASEAAAQQWIDHASFLFPDDNERAFLLDYLAHIVQHRGVKIQFAPILIGAQGVGKDLLLNPIVAFLGDSNTRQVDPEDFNPKTFGDFFESELCIVQEITRHGRHDYYERMKALISTTTGNKIKINRKYMMPYEVENFVNFVFFSNHTDAVSLSEDDRRFFVIESPAFPQKSGYYKSLVSFYENGGTPAVISWLKARDLSNFNPGGRPMMTDAKTNMVSESRAPVIREVADALYHGQLAARTIMDNMELLKLVKSDYTFDARTRDDFKWPNQATNALKAAGWVARPVQVRVEGKKLRLWCRTQEIAALGPDVLKDRLLEERQDGQRAAA